MKRIKSFNKHYILCGADLLGTRIAEEFSNQNIDYVVVDENEELIKTTLLYSHPEYFREKLKTLFDFHEVDLSEYEHMSLAELSEKVNVPYLVANPTDDSVLIQAGIDRAAGLIAARPDDRDNLSIVIGARNLAKRANNDSIRIMTTANEPGNMRKLLLAGADFVRMPTIVSGMEMASHILHPEIGYWWYTGLGEEGYKSTKFYQENINDHPAWIGWKVGKLHEALNIIILSVKRDGKFISPPPFDFVLQTDDIAIVLK